MPKSQKTVRQHFVHESFQRNFASARDKCKILKFEDINDTLSYRLYGTNTRDNFVVNNLNELYFQDMDGLESELNDAYCNKIENMLSQFEGDWAITIQRLRELVEKDLRRHTNHSLKCITESDLISLIALMTTMHYRNVHRFVSADSEESEKIAHLNILGAQSLFSVGPKRMSDVEKLKDTKGMQIWSSKMEYVTWNANKYLTHFNINIAHKDTFGFMLPEDPSMFHETDAYIIGSLPITPMIQIQFYINKMHVASPYGIIPELNYLTKGETKLQVKNHSLFGGNKAIVQNEKHAKQVFNIVRKSL